MIRLFQAWCRQERQQARAETLACARYLHAHPDNSLALAALRVSWQAEARVEADCRRIESLLAGEDFSQGSPEAAVH